MNISRWISNENEENKSSPLQDHSLLYPFYVIFDFSLILIGMFCRSYSSGICYSNFEISFEY